jgi:GNAT superfamily N-acetyltransferase
MTDHAAYTVERLTASNLHHLDTLHQAVYGKPVAGGFYERKYHTVYTGVQYIGFIAFSPEGTAIGYYGVIPCFLSCNGRRMLAAQSADTMTHPGYRLKGLFVELANLTYNLCRENGIRLVIGFPNQHSYHGAVQKLGWKMTGSMSCFTLPVKTWPLEKLAMRLSMTNMYNRLVKGVLKRYAVSRISIANQLLTEGYAGIDRDAAHMAYKTYTSNQVITIGSAIAWIKIKNGLIIGDLQVESARFEQAIKKIKQLAAILGTRQVQFHISPGTALHTLFSERYAAAPSFPVLFQDLDSGLPLAAFKFSFADIDIF